MNRVLLLAAVMLTTTLAGCTTDDNPAAALDEPATATEALTVDSMANVGAPQWAVRDWFGHHFFFGPDDDEGVHVNVIVTEDLGSQWFLATDSPEVAKWEAVFDLPITGPLSKADLATTGFSGPWDYYDFPMRDGHSWQGTVSGDFVEAGEPLTFTATLNERIQTPYGPRPGFDIAGVTGDGFTQVITDYVPELGWYTNFEFYDPEEPDAYQFKSISMGFGSNWTGTYYVDTATELVQHIDITAANPDDPAASSVSPSPHATFTVSEAANYITGFYFDFAFAGAHDTEVIDPNNERHQFTVTDTGAAGAGTADLIDLPLVAGEWRIVSGGAGVAHGSGLLLWEVLETAGTL